MCDGCLFLLESRASDSKHIKNKKINLESYSGIKEDFYDEAGHPGASRGMNFSHMPSGPAPSVHTRRSCGQHRAGRREYSR